MSVLTNISEYKQYFNTIVYEHKLLSAFRYGGLDSVIDFLNSNEDGIESFVMWLEPYSAKPKLRADSKLIEKTGSLVVMHPWEAGNYDNDVDASFKAQTTLETTCEQIVIDIISRMKRDSDADDIRTDFANFQYDIIDVSFTGSYVGVRLEFDFNHGQNICYDANNWN